jgi:His/Glu/Gln/Arg/opine family amino acid ABC transporter permease subunit
MAVQSQQTSAPAPQPLVDERPPFVLTRGMLFNIGGWAAFGLIIVLVVIPSISRGVWSTFGEWSSWTFLWDGLMVTVQVAVYSIILSMILGILFALGRLSPNKLISVPSVVYIELMRALPSYLIIFFAFIGLPVIFRDVPGMGWLAALDALWYAVIGLTLYTSAVMAEIVRAGILSVEKGQLEAAYSLGLNPIGTLRQIVLPQALRRMAPNIVSQLITLTKDTSLASIIALQDLTRKGKQLYQQQANVIETMLIVGLIYFVICYSLALLSKRLELRKKK